MKTSEGESLVNTQSVWTADNDYHKFLIEGKVFMFKGEQHCKLLVFNQSGREIAQCAISADNFSKFLGFLKGKAKF